MNYSIIYFATVIILLIVIVIYTFYEEIQNLITDKNNDLPKENDINRKKFWMRELLILFKDINNRKCFFNYDFKTEVTSEEASFITIGMLVDSLFRLYETNVTGYMCNHVRLILFKGYENLTEKDYALVYSIILMLDKFNDKQRASI